jgi:surface antigen/peptidoglycan hydrolase CwlO-like protein
VSGVANADSFDDQINALKGQEAAQQASADALHAQANNYQQQVAQYQAQINLLRSQIALNQAQMNRLNAQIADAKAKLEKQKTILSEDIKAMYLSSTVTPLEMLASSKNISDFFDQQQYQDSMKDKIQAAMDTIVQLKAQLEGQQKNLLGILSAQSAQQAQLQQTQSQLASLEAVAEQNASAADAQVRNSNSQIASLREQQAAALAAASVGFDGTIPGASGGSGGACDNGHGNGGYPMSWCNAPQDSITTPWGYSRECVSWAGWRRKDLGRVAYGWGNANQWANGARSAGLRVDSSPEVGAIAQTSAGPFGHVAVVEAVSGSSVIVSEMNYDDAGHYRLGKYPAAYFVYIH